MDSSPQNQLPDKVSVDVRVESRRILSSPNDSFSCVQVCQSSEGSRNRRVDNATACDDGTTIRQGGYDRHDSMLHADL